MHDYTGKTVFVAGGTYLLVELHYGEVEEQVEAEPHQLSVHRRQLERVAARDEEPAAEGSLVAVDSLEDVVQNGQVLR